MMPIAIRPALQAALFLSLAMLCRPALAAEPALLRQVQQHGITWTFAEPVRAGQFINGDWWVIPAAGQAQVRVAGVDPAPALDAASAADSRRHGSMINPRPGGTQGYDGRANGYSAAVSASFPLDLPINSSLVSTRSRPERDAFNPPGTGLFRNTQSRGFLADAAVLTCLAEAPAADAFRPPYCGQDKPILRASALDLSRLPALASVPGTPRLADYEAAFGRVWLEHLTGWPGQSIRPNNHMPSYGRDIARHIGDGALLLCLGDIGDRTKLAHGMVQMGIDFHGIAAAGGGWPADGGHGHGRKLPIVLAGFLLHDPAGAGAANDHAREMLHVGRRPRHGQAGPWRFQEDENFFTITEADTRRSLEVMGCAGLARSATADDIGVSHPARYATLVGNTVQITAGPGQGQRRTIIRTDIGRTGGDGILAVDRPWDMAPVAGQSRYQVMGYQAHHVGLAEWGIRHAQSPERDNPSWAAEYRDLVGYSSTGFTLAARLIGLQDAWNHDPLFAYMDRYMNTTGNRSLSPFAGNMWRAYRNAR
jgi:hypothetical protein